MSGRRLMKLDAAVRRLLPRKRDLMRSSRLRSLSPSEVDELASLQQEIDRLEAEEAALLTATPTSADEEVSDG